MKTMSILRQMIALAILLIAQCSFADVLTTKSGARYEGTAQDLGDEYVLTKPDGGKMTISKSMVLSLEKGPARPVPVAAPFKGAEPKPLAAQTEEPAGLPKLKERIVTGIGIDPEKALQNAFSQAIEQAVGVLVRAETVVKNEKLIHDEVLTLSRGYLESYEEVRRWQEDGLYHVKIRAVVGRDKLVAKLRDIKIALVDVPGAKASIPIETGMTREEKAAAMLMKALSGFDMVKLTHVEPVGKPEIKRDGSGVTVRVQVRLSPEQQAWGELAKECRPILSEMSTGKSPVTMAAMRGGNLAIFFGRNPGSSKQDQAQQRLLKQLAGDGVLVGLFSGKSVDGSRMEWEMFRVPQALEGAIKACLPPSYHIVYTLLDEDGKEVASTREPVKAQWDPDYPDARAVFEPILRSQCQLYPLESAWWIGPVWTYFHGLSEMSVLTTEATFSISPQDLGRVAKAAVFLEADGTRSGTTK